MESATLLAESSYSFLHFDKNEKPKIRLCFKSFKYLGEIEKCSVLLKFWFNTLSDLLAYEHVSVL